jgi:tRNA (adenine22-N1)-methyltransferase
MFKELINEETEIFMQLSKRLHAVASLVTPGNRVADVGCDHAYTSIYLVEKEIANKVIAMDVNQGPIDRAKDNIEKYGYSNQIVTRRSNGLEKLLEEEADTILIAGMGGALTIQILEEKQELVQQIKELILQPQSEINKVRVMLQERNFAIVRESMVKDDGKFYMMMKAIPKGMVSEPDQYELTKKEHYYYGRLLLEEKHPILQEFLLWDFELCGNILHTLRAEQTENTKAREKEIEEKIALIQCGLEYYKD